MTDAQRLNAISRLGDAVSLWRLSAHHTAGVIDAATQALVADIDTPSLRELAGASSKDSQFVLEPLIRQTMEELDLGSVLESNPQHGAMAAMVRRFIDGGMSAKELTEWAHKHIGHDGDGRSQEFVELDDIFDLEFDADVLDRRVRAAAQAFFSSPADGSAQVSESRPDRWAVILQRKRMRRSFTVRVQPSGREFWASSWDSLYASLPEMGVPW